MVSTRLGVCLSVSVLCLGLVALIAGICVVLLVPSIVEERVKKVHYGFSHHSEMSREWTVALDFLGGDPQTRRNISQSMDSSACDGVDSVLDIQRDKSDGDRVPRSEAYFETERALRISVSHSSWTLFFLVFRRFYASGSNFKSGASYSRQTIRSLFLPTRSTFSHLSCRAMDAVKMTRSPFQISHIWYAHPLILLRAISQGLLFRQS